MCVILYSLLLLVVEATGGHGNDLRLFHKRMAVRIGFFLGAITLTEQGFTACIQIAQSRCSC